MIVIAGQLQCNFSTDQPTKQQRHCPRFPHLQPNPEDGHLFTIILISFATITDCFLMEIAGLTLASLSAAHELFNCGLRIYTRIKNEKKLNDKLREFQIFEMEDKKAELRLDIELAQTVLKSLTIDLEHKERLVRNWVRIKELMARIDSLLDAMINNSSLLATNARHKARNELLDLGGNQALRTAISEFHDAVMGLRELNKDDSPLFLSDNDFLPIESENRISGPVLRTFLGKGKLTNAWQDFPSTVQWFLYESKPYLIHKKETAKENVRILAQKLHKAQPESGVLKLMGFRDEFDGQKGAFELVFASPFNSTFPDTLSSFIQTHGTKPSLNHRISLCHQLATAVLQTQTLGLVHKNIRPENILLLIDKTSPAMESESTPTLYLSGWQYARHVDGSATTLKGEVTLQSKIYQHPERQLPTAEREYSMAHDVYSLGVCMLEIFIWESLLLPTSPPSVSTTFIDAFKAIYHDTGPLSPEDRYTKYPNEIKSTLVSLTNTYIPTAAGMKMSRLVYGFLTCLDEGSDDYDDKGLQSFRSKDKDRRQIAMRFVDTALKDLRDVQSAI